MARPEVGGGRTLGQVLLLSAILTQSCQSYIFQAFNYDKVVQAAAGQAWLDGRGFVAPAVGENQRAAFVPVVQWPPGYSVAYAAAITVTRDPFFATWIIDLLAAVAFFSAWWPLAQAARSPSAARIVFVYWIFAASAITHLPSSDAVALAAYSIALAAGLGAARGGRTYSCVASGLAAGVAGAVRFAYWPLAWIPIAPFIWTRRNDVRAWRDVALYGVAAALPIAWAGATNMKAAGTVATVFPGGAAASGPFWRQMLPLPAFGATALGVDDAWRRLAVSVPALRPMLDPAFWCVTIAVVALAVAVARRELTADGAGDAWPRTLAVWGTLTFAVTAVLVTALAVRVPAYPDGWTYMTDAARYLAPAYPFLLLAIADTCRRPFRLQALTAAGLLVVCGLSVLAYRTGQLSLYAVKNADLLPSGRGPHREIRTVFAAVRAHHHDINPVVYCDPNPVRRSIATMAGAASMVVCPDRQDRVDQPYQRTLTPRIASDGAFEIVER